MAVLNNPIRIPMKATSNMEAVKFTVGYKVIAGNYEEYDGAYEATPTTEEQTLATKGYAMRKDVRFHAVPYSEVQNLGGGLTANIGG